jgi:phosphoserine phosphatase
VLDQCGLTAMDLANVVNMEETEKSLSRVAGLLQGLPGDLLERIIASCRVAPGSLELVQTLKVMGYRIVVVTAGIAPLADSLTTKLGLDACYGYPLAIHEDRRTVEPADGASLPDIETVKAGLLGQSGSSAADIIVLSDRTLGAPRSPGISLVPDLRQILEFTNQRILNRDQLLGILGAFGIPELPGRDS